MSEIDQDIALYSQSEAWLPVPEYEGFYEVSNMGTVRSVDRQVNHNYGGKAFRKGKVLKQAGTTKGYKEVALNMNGKPKHFRVHRLVAMAFIPNPYDLPQVNHINFDLSSNYDWNLEWCTPEQNHRHSTNHNRKGVKLTAEDVLNIRELWACSQMTQKTIAKGFDVRPHTISQIVNRKSWKHI